MATVIKMADTAIPMSPVRCRDLRPARSTTNSYRETNNTKGVDEVMNTWNFHYTTAEIAFSTSYFAEQKGAILRLLTTLAVMILLLTDTTVNAVLTTPVPMVA